MAINRKIFDTFMLGSQFAAHTDSPMGIANFAGASLDHFFQNCPGVFPRPWLLLLLVVWAVQTLGLIRLIGHADNRDSGPSLNRHE